jgi:hypothetical protein
MRSKSADYRLNAVNCLTVGQQTTDLGTKAKLLAMARAWFALANQADRNCQTDLVYETPRPMPKQEPEQPGAQQQQQVQPDKEPDE